MNYLVILERFDILYWELGGVQILQRPFTLYLEINTESGAPHETVGLVCFNKETLTNVTNLVLPGIN